MAGRILMLGLVFGLSRAQQDLASLDVCAQACINGLINNGAALGCEASRVGCLCAKPEFGFGIRDCVLEACAPTAVAQATNYATALCATARLAAETTAEPTTTEPPEAAEETTAEETTERPTPSVAPQSTAEDEEEPSTASPSNTESPSETTSTKSPTETTKSTGAEADGDSESAEESLEDDEDDDEGEDDEDDEEEEPAASSGLSTSAKVGIGIGAGFGGILLIALGFFAIASRFGRKKKNVDHISGPMPGSGRDFGDVHALKEAAGMSELELRSRRYEDMLPRQQPQPV